MSNFHYFEGRTEGITPLAQNWQTQAESSSVTHSFTGFSDTDIGIPMEPRPREEWLFCSSSSQGEEDTLQYVEARL
jgi:hypothetical protein